MQPGRQQRLRIWWVAGPSAYGSTMATIRAILRCVALWHGVMAWRSARAHFTSFWLSHSIYAAAKNELEGMNVSLLMPQPFSQRHPSYLSRYVNGGEPHILDTVREVVGLHKVRACARTCADVRPYMQPMAAYGEVESTKCVRVHAPCLLVLLALRCLTARHPSSNYFPLPTGPLRVPAVALCDQNEWHWHRQVRQSLHRCAHQKPQTKRLFMYVYVTQASGSASQSRIPLSPSFISPSVSTPSAPALTA